MRGGRWIALWVLVAGPLGCSDDVIESQFSTSDVGDDSSSTSSATTELDSSTSTSTGDDSLDDSSTSTSGESEGSSSSDDGSTSDTGEEFCGDGVLTRGEQCDTAGRSATCDEDCTLPVCG